MVTPATSESARVRLDKWLWAARFYKTRSKASEAIAGGHVKGGGQRLKAGHAVAIGEQINLTKDGLEWEVVVLALSDKRGKGADAQLLYAETDPGRERRLAQLEALKQARMVQPVMKGRPTKRDRRELVRFRVSGFRRGEEDNG